MAVKGGVVVAVVVVVLLLHVSLAYVHAVVTSLLDRQHDQEQNLTTHDDVTRLPEASNSSLTEDPTDSGARRRLPRQVNKDKKGFNKTEQRQLVDNHNEVRRKKKSSNMRKMQWDLGLAKLSQDWASQCKDKERPEVNRTVPGFGKVGENYFAATYYSGVKDVIGQWLEQKADYNYVNNTCAYYCEAYKQMVWANTSSVGCGISFCAKLVDFQKGGFRIVCNYAPKGNTPGIQPYKLGKACSECGPGFKLCQKGLCASESSSSSRSAAPSLPIMWGCLMWGMMWITWPHSPLSMPNVVTMWIHTLPA